VSPNPDIRPFRMFALDLDGTLLGPDGRVSSATLDALHNAAHAGWRICFATGRNLTESQAVLDAVGMDGPAVFVGGAIVIDTARRLTLKRTPMHPRLAAEICGVLEAAGHAALALQDTGRVGVDYLVTRGAMLNESTRLWMHTTAAQVSARDDLARMDHQHTIRVGIVGDPEEVRAVQQSIERRFAGRVLCQSLFVPASRVEVLEIFDPSVSKWDGVSFVAGLWGIEGGQVIAVGDDVNDIAMIRGAGLGVAMGNAKPNVKAVAARVIDSNANDGLATFINQAVAGRI